jgi:DNA adenine methylase
MKRFKTPLRYPGGKSRATKILLNYIPERYYRYVEPFIGGGSMAIALQVARPDLQITINDLYTPLYAFWKTLQDDGPALSTHLFQTKTALSAYEDKEDVIKAHREAFNLAKQRLNEELSVYEMGYYFYICNKCSFSGLGESSSFSPQASQSNFNESGINSLTFYHQVVRNWDIKNDDYTSVLDEEGAFNFLDPPYLIKDNLYGKKGAMHKSFDHKRMADTMSSFQGMTMITYNSCPQVEALYPDWSKLQWDLTYTMRSTGTYGADQDKRKELLLVNYGIDNTNKQWYK